MSLQSTFMLSLLMVSSVVISSWSEQLNYLNCAFHLPSIPHTTTSGICPYKKYTRLPCGILFSLVFSLRGTPKKRESKISPFSPFQLELSLLMPTISEDPEESMYPFQMKPKVACKPTALTLTENESLNLIKILRYTMSYVH